MKALHLSPLQNQLYHLCVRELRFLLVFPGKFHREGLHWREMPRRPPKQTDINAQDTTRMDAALGAMRQHGFPDMMVRETVRELLRVHTGEWHFIEVDAYRTLIEALLEKQNQRETKEVEASKGSRKTGDTSTMLIATPSSKEASSEHEDEAAMDEALSLAPPLPTLQNDHPRGSEGYRRGVKRDHDSGGGRQASASTSNVKRSGAKDIVQSAVHLLPPCGSPPPVVASGVNLRTLPPCGPRPQGINLRSLPPCVPRPQVVASGVNLRSLPPCGPPRRRHRYHGLIGGEEDDDDFVCLGPPLLPEYLTYILGPDILRSMGYGWRSRGSGASEEGPSEEKAGPEAKDS